MKLVYPNSPRPKGRYHIVDSRDKKYRVDVPRLRARAGSKTWSCKGYHDGQDGQSRCVGSGWSFFMHSSPTKQWVDPQGLYELAKTQDEWEGTDYDGTSVRAGAKVLSMLGVLSEYRWTWDANEAAAVILTQGPMVVGTDWYEGMSLPNRAGIMSIDGEYEGGHCYLLFGYNTRTELFRVKTWDESWAKGGFGYISKPDLQILLDADGEACIGVERILKA